MTDAEIDVLADNPVRVPKLNKIRDHARSVSHKAYGGDPTVPEDAYRHTLWSFTLTNEYGPEFAQTVTDAHEIGATWNTEADHRMDYNNNKVGRDYAKAGVPESDILKRVLEDPAVIRSPQ